MHIRHQLDFALRRSCPAYAAANGDQRTGRLPQERTKVQRIRLQQIEAGPVDVVQRVPQQCRRIGQRRHRRTPLRQRLNLLRQQGIELRFFLGPDGFLMHVILRYST